MILLHGHKTGTARQKEAGVPACNYRDALAEPGVGAPAPSKAAPDHRFWKAADSLETGLSAGSQCIYFIHCHLDI